MVYELVGVGQSSAAFLGSSLRTYFEASSTTKMRLGVEGLL
jgi:hypothetical protein